MGKPHVRVPVPSDDNILQLHLVVSGLFMHSHSNTFVETSEVAVSLRFSEDVNCMSLASANCGDAASTGSSDE